MNMDPNTEDAADARHNVAQTFEELRHAAHAPENGPSIEMPERGKSQTYHPGGYVPFEGFTVPESMKYSPTGMVAARPGLHFIADHGVMFTDMGRTLTEPDQLENVHEVDLRTMLAHLDATARAVVRELEARGLGARPVVR